MGEDLPRNPSYVEIHQEEMEEMLFEVFSIFSSGRHFVQQNGTV